MENDGTRISRIMYIFLGLVGILGLLGLRHHLPSATIPL